MKISIITATLNSERYLAEALRTVREQSYGHVEHVIIDGGSTDGTLKIIDQFRGSLAYVVSEPDGGISNAFNKGISACTGDIVGIVSSDDGLLAGALDAVVECYEREHRPDVIHGNCFFIDPISRERFLSKPDVMLTSALRGQPLKHGAVFVRREAYARWGVFDVRYRYAMDYDLILRFISGGARFAYIDKPLALIRLGGANNRHRRLARRESLQISIEHGCPRWKARLYYWDKIARDVAKNLAAAYYGDGLVRAYRRCIGRTFPMRRDIRLIAFSGIDGAGKTTQIDLLCKILRINGVDVIKFWARGGYTPLFSAAKRGLRRIHSGSLPSGNSALRRKRMASPWLRKVWLTVAMLDLIFWYALWLRWKRVWGATIVCDRYLEDTRLDFRRNFPQERFESGWLWRFLERITPTPDLAFLLIVPVEESLRRSKMKNEPFPDSPETLAWRLAEYRQLAARGGWTVLDCTRDQDAVQDEIRRAVAV